MNKIFEKFISIFFIISFITIGAFYGINNFIWKQYKVKISRERFEKIRDNVKDIKIFTTPDDIKKQGVMIEHFTITTLRENKTRLLNEIEKTILDNKNIEDIPPRVPMYKILYFYDGTRLLHFLVRYNEEDIVTVTMTLESLEGYIFLKRGFEIGALIFITIFNCILAYFISKKISQTVERKKKFIRGLTHELKTPVAVISGYVESIKEGIVDEGEAESYYETIERQIGNLDSMITDILFYSKIESGVTNVEMEEFDMKEFLKRILKNFHLDIENIIWEEDIDEEKVISNRKLLSIIITNLLTNAFTHCDDRKVVKISFKKKVLEISNSSRYMDDSEVKKLFESFKKLNAGNKGKYGGTGLGLSIVSQFIGVLNLQSHVYYRSDQGELVFQIKFL